MSIKSAEEFLAYAARSQDFRDMFKEIQTAEAFAQRCQELGYDFTPDELLEVAKQKSEGVNYRRKVGVWPWLRGMTWLKVNQQGELQRAES